MSLPSEVVRDEPKLESQSFGGHRVVDVKNGVLKLDSHTTLYVRASRKGFFIGCTFVTWEAWDELKKKVE
jgi:hypothetical protein